MVYLITCLPFMFLTASLAVDYGRAQSAKTELQSAVDAAARAAAEDLVNFNSTDTATANAIYTAAANKVDGTSLVLQTSDVVFGTWTPASKTFVPGTPSPNAVQITGRRTAATSTPIPTMLAAVIGNGSIDIHATSTIYVSQEMAPFNALGNVTFNDTGNSNGGIWTTDSYIGNTTNYSSSTARNNGHLLTNGNVTYNFVTPANGQGGFENRISSIVMGTIYSANGQDCQKNWAMNSTQGGTQWVEWGGLNNPGPSTSQMSTPATFTTPAMPSNNTNPSIPGAFTSGSYPNNLHDLVVNDGSNVTLPGGVYTLNSLSITNGSTVTFTGPVTLDIASNVTIDSASIVGSSNDPKCLVINGCNTGPAGANNVTINNLTKPLYADLNAPLANLTFTQPDGGNGFYGRTRCNDMTVNTQANGGIHGDESLLMAFHVVK